MAASARATRPTLPPSSTTVFDAEMPGLIEQRPAAQSHDCDAMPLLPLMCGDAQHELLHAPDLKTADQVEDPQGLAALRPSRGSGQWAVGSGQCRQSSDSELPCPLPTATACCCSLSSSPRSHRRVEADRHPRQHRPELAPLLDQDVRPDFEVDVHLITQRLGERRLQIASNPRSEVDSSAAMRTMSWSRCS